MLNQVATDGIMLEGEKLEFAAVLFIPQKSQAPVHYALKPIFVFTLLLAVGRFKVYGRIEHRPRWGYFASARTLCHRSPARGENL